MNFLVLMLNCVFVAVFCAEGWSAPSAIGIAGLGGGFEIGLEVRCLSVLKIS